MNAKYYLIPIAFVVCLLCELPVDASTIGYAEVITSNFKLSVSQTFPEREDAADGQEAAFFELHGEVAMRLLRNKIITKTKDIFEELGLLEPKYSSTCEVTQSLRISTSHFGLGNVVFTICQTEPWTVEQKAELIDRMEHMISQLVFYHNFERHLMMGSKAIQTFGDQPYKVQLGETSGLDEYEFSFRDDLTFSVYSIDDMDDDSPYFYGKHLGVWEMKDEKILTLYFTRLDVPLDLCPCKDRNGVQYASFYIKERLVSGFVLERMR